MANKITYILKILHRLLYIFLQLRVCYNKFFAEVEKIRVLS